MTGFDSLWRRHLRGVRAVAAAAETARAHVGHAEAVGGRRSRAEVVVEGLRRLLHLHAQRPEPQDSRVLVIVLKQIRKLFSDQLPLAEAALTTARAS